MKKKLVAFLAACLLALGVDCGTSDAQDIIYAGGNTPRWECVQWRTRYCHWTS